jgi:MSHA biogenesis protein MshQ
MATWGPTAIQAGADDGYERVDNTTWYGVQTYEYVGITGGITWHGGFRWDSVTIPNGATIDSAYLTFYWNGADHYGSTVVLNVQAWDHDDAPQFDNTNRPSTVTRTTASVSWSVANPGTHPATKTSPDIKSVIKEIVDRAGWASGNAINLVCMNSNTGDKFGTIDTYETVSGTKPTLTITYTESASSSLECIVFSD